MKTVIAENLSKTYEGGKTAVNRINLSLNQGEVFGFLGPNGSGKTTAVKLFVGTLSPTEGSCRVFGHDPTEAPEKVHMKSGVVTEHAQMYDNLTGLENLIFYSSLFGLDKYDAKERSLELLKGLNLLDSKDKKLSNYSTGMRQRLSLARAMVHRPEILFLDEPTSGLDPESVHEVNLMIRNLAKNENTTVFLCTHQLRYAQEICDRYGLMDTGSLLACGNLSELRDMISSGVRLEIRAKSMPKNPLFTKKEQNLYEANINSENEIPEIINHIVLNGGEIFSVISEEPSLEEIYFSLLNQTPNSKDGAK